MKPGPRPKPAAMKRLEGNPGRRKLPTTESVGLPGEPEPPVWLEPLALETWRSVVPGLHACGIVGLADEIILGVYCNTVSLYRQVNAELREAQRQGDSIVDERASHLEAKLRLLAESIRKTGSELGLSPAARVGLPIAGGDQEETPIQRLMPKTFGKGKRK